MADIFCDDGGSNTAPYETWAKAATTFLVAVDAASAGDDIIIGHDHAEAPGATSYVFPGTATAINRVISCTSTAGGSVKTYNKADNIQVAITGGGTDMIFQGHVRFYGVSFSVADDFRMVSTNSFNYFSDSLLTLAGSTSVISAGNNLGKCNLILENTDISWTTGGANCVVALTAASFIWRGGAVIWSGTQPTALFNAGARDNNVSISGVDLSAITSALFDASDATYDLVNLHHCLLNSAVSLTTGTQVSMGKRFFMSGCDDSTGNDLYRLEYVDFWGSTVHDDAIYRDGGASDGTTNISWKMVSTANATEFSEPTKSPPIYGWVDATGSTTFTTSIVWDSASDLQDDEVWLELEYLEASADTDSAFADDRMADITATPADQTNNTETWTGTGGFGTANKIEVAVTVTVNRVGPIIARVCLAKPSTTIYVDPKIEKS